MFKFNFSLLNKKEKIYFFALFFLFIIASFLEALGIGLIYPIINLVLNDTYLQNVYYKKYLLDFNFTKIQITVFGLCVLSFVFLFITDFLRILRRGRSGRNLHLGRPGLALGSLHILHRRRYE